MAGVVVSQEKLVKLLTDVEALITDVSSLLNQDDIARQRLAEVRADPGIGLSEEELDAYLASRGINGE